MEIEIKLLKEAAVSSPFFLYIENHAIVAWFKKGLTGEKKLRSC